MAVRPMSEAPRDGTRILLRYVVFHYRRPTKEELGRVSDPQYRRMLSRQSSWMPDGSKWEECRWIDDRDRTGSPPHWEPWEGNPRTRTTHHISPKDCLGWMELPDEA